MNSRTACHALLLSPLYFAILILVGNPALASYIGTGMPILMLRMLGVSAATVGAWFAL